VDRRKKERERCAAALAEVQSSVCMCLFPFPLVYACPVKSRLELKSCGLRSVLGLLQESCLVVSRLFGLGGLRGVDGTSWRRNFEDG
jgi:hypothetical protein